MIGWAKERVGCAVAFAACAVAACAASCGGSAFSNADGGGTAEGGATRDGTADVAANDGPATGPGDSGPSDAPAEAAGGYCATHPGHTFCEDFDEYADTTALINAWSSFVQIGGSFKFDKTDAPSPPNALEVVGTNGAKVVVLKNIPVSKTATKLRLDFDLRINLAGSVGLLSAAGLAALAFGNSISDGFAAIAIGNGPTLSAAWVDQADAGTSDAGAFKTSNANGGFPTAGVWAARYAIEIDYSSTGGCVQIYQGPTALLNNCLQLPPALLHPSVVSLVLGDYTAGFGNTGSIDVEFDDVTFDET